MPTDPNREKFLALLRSALDDGSLAKVTLARYQGADRSLRNVFVRPVSLAAGPRLSFVWRHATRDVTKNLGHGAGLSLLGQLVGSDFLDAHFFTPGQHAQLECQPGAAARLRVGAPAETVPPAAAHDQAKSRIIDARARWLRALGVVDERGRPQRDMAPKFRQIQKFAELVGHLAAEAGLAEADPLSVADMGCGKGYLTFAVSSVLPQARVRGIEARPELAELCNRVAAEQGFAPRLSFHAGTIQDTPLEATDILIALHACDTATDDALAKGISSGCRLMLVAPCCQKELRPQLTAPPVLASALRHGIFLERQAEFVTDALRAQLLEWAGYRTRVIEFISTEHTAKNVLITALKKGPGGDETIARRVRDFAAFYGIKRQALAEQIGFQLVAPLP